MTIRHRLATVLVLIAALAGPSAAEEPAPAPAAPAPAPAVAPPAPAAPAPAPVADWVAGTGTIAGDAARIGATVGSGVVIANTQEKATAQIALAGFKHGVITLGPDATLTLTAKPGVNQLELEIAVDKGTIEVDIDGTGPYTAFAVNGAALDVKVTGTLFMVERAYRDADYVALIRGKVHVSLRKAVAAKLGGDQSVDLSPRQGVLGSSNGLAAVDTFSNRPAIGGDRGSLHNQATEPLVGDGGWDGGGPGGPDIESLAPGVVDAITVDIDIPSQIVDEIVTTVVNGGAADLGGPPPPPGP